MAISEQKLAQIIAHSKNICSEEGAKKVRSHGGAGNLKDMNPDDYSDEWDNFSLSDINEEQMSEQSNYGQQISYDEQSVLNSKLPDAIKKSLIENPISQNANVNMGAIAQMAMGGKPNNRKPLNENSNVSQQSVPQNIGLDYNYLKYIINEAISEYFQKNPIQNGNALKQIYLKEGKIKLIDNSGNIFSAQLEHEGNLKDKKK